MTIDQALHGLDVGRVAHLLGVFEVRFERTAENAAERIDLLAGQRQAVLELDAVGRGEVGQRRGLADRDGGRPSARAPSLRLASTAAPAVALAAPARKVRRLGMIFGLLNPGP